MHVFVGNFTYVIDFMIVEDISSIIDPRLSQVVLGRPFVEISNMTHDPPEEKSNTNSSILEQERTKKRSSDVIQDTRFYKECLKLDEYLTGIDYKEKSRKDGDFDLATRLVKKKTLLERQPNFRILEVHVCIIDEKKLGSS
ncbi:hypothetical protein Tco_0666014 [Tanacetum coccineum]